MQITMKEDELIEEAHKNAEKLLDEVKIDFFDLSESSVKKADQFLLEIYMKWKNSEIDDLTAGVIDELFEGEPIHHLMNTSVYPLADIVHQYCQNNQKQIEEWKSGVRC